MYLFVYGELKPGQKLNRLLGNYKMLGQDFIRGDMYNLGSEPAVINVGKSKADFVVGYLVDIPHSDLKRLDTEEEIKDKYTRVQVVTKHLEKNAQMYVYTGSIPKKVIKQGTIRDWSPTK